MTPLSKTQIKSFINFISRMGKFWSREKSRFQSCETFLIFTLFRNRFIEFWHFYHLRLFQPNGLHRFSDFSPPTTYLKATRESVSISTLIRINGLAKRCSKSTLVWPRTDVFATRFPFAISQPSDCLVQTGRMND